MRIEECSELLGPSENRKADSKPERMSWADMMEEDALSSVLDSFTQLLQGHVRLAKDRGRNEAVSQGFDDRH